MKKIIKPFTIIAFGIIMIFNINANLISGSNENFDLANLIKLNFASAQIEDCTKTLPTVTDDT
ncbi:hypothetical protein NO995_07615 [Aestuariibaculum sp. M13]|uniref:hypothetical protein n=1 Tax=Aestuariibaculum sp. M13 TaxID=2967132 RepID=UPI002159D529|nr:hypothetical protein [Aestuariibaculum sp. M13]MCR8667543.1 hypothetical protein [Aestuariibaculum sp. M13]